MAVAEAPSGATQAPGGEHHSSSLWSRRSVSPRRLEAPGPTAEQLDLMIQAALCAPDHGSLRPWRVIEFGHNVRAQLADLFEQEKLRREPSASKVELSRSREHAIRPPVLLAFVVGVVHRSKVPHSEQWLAAGAALGNMLNAAHAMGFGAIVLSGERCFDGDLSSSLGLKPSEYLAGFISVGRVAQPPRSRPPVLPASVWQRWCPEAVECATVARRSSSPKASETMSRPAASKAYAGASHDALRAGNPRGATDEE